MVTTCQTFTCTFCWKTYSNPSETIGRRARIACQPCHDAIISLSICWVCGEIIVRGEEVVSLGWCFWHQACFGCLICSSPLKLPIPREIRFEDPTGIELTTPPLCTFCQVSVEGLRPTQVPMRGMEHVDDGNRGLSAAHRSEAQSRRGEVRTQSPASSYMVPRTPHESRESTTDIGSGESQEADDRPLYISIQDPINGPAFRSNPTKPIPKWMAFLPSNRQTQLERLSTEAQSGSPVGPVSPRSGNPSPLYEELNESDISDDESSKRQGSGTRSLRTSTPFPSPGNQTAKPRPTRKNSYIRLPPMPNGASISFSAPLTGTGQKMEISPETKSKPVSEHQKTPYPLVKDVGKEEELSSYFALPKRGKSVNETNRGKGRYIPPDETESSGVRGKLRRETVGETSRATAMGQNATSGKVKDKGKDKVDAERQWNV